MSEDKPASSNLTALITACALALPAPALAQALCLVPELPQAAQPGSPAAPPSGAVPDEVEVIFDRLIVDSGADAEFTDNVELRYQDQVFTAERAFYDRSEDSFEFQGRVTYRDTDIALFGEDAAFDAETGEVRFGAAGFELLEESARGSAGTVSVNENTGTVRFEGVRFTTCPLEQMAWEIIADDVDIDVDGGVGAARRARLKFGRLPLLYAPYFSFPVNDERKSGFLTPDFSERDRTGIGITAPYYFNLAPNYDLVLEPRFLSKRGVQIVNEFRYLLPRGAGSFNFEILPQDSAIDRTRRYLNLQHTSLLGENWQLTTAIEEVSDNAYFEDLGNSLSVTSQTHLNRYVDFAYNAPRWQILTRLQNYQTIDPFLVDTDLPYERAPQFLFDGTWGAGRWQYTAESELVNFDRAVGTTGWRFDTTQEIGARFGNAGMYIAPAVAWRQTNYWLQDAPAGSAAAPGRGLPIASLDAGLTFERNLRRNQGRVQTLEPRILYVNVPFEDQSDLPVFDTIVPDFNLVQLFRKYQFVGADRVSDADQLSFGMTTRLIDADSGRERLAATIGRTRYLSPQRVALPGETPAGNGSSDYIAEMKINLRDAWSLETAYQWNSETAATSRAETRLEYRPKEDRLFGVGYRYRSALLKQGDLSLVWPVSERWRIIGRYSYSLLEREPLEQFVGWEYDACCWRLRVIGRQYVSRRTGETDSALTFQLELKGLSNAISRPEELLDRGILGYRSLPGSSAL